MQVSVFIIMTIIHLDYHIINYVRWVVVGLFWTVCFTLRKFQAEELVPILTSREKLVPIRHRFHTNIFHV